MPRRTWNEHLIWQEITTSLLWRCTSGTRTHMWINNWLTNPFYHILWSFYIIQFDNLQPILDVVKELIKAMNAYSQENVFKFCNDILDYTCSDKYDLIYIENSYKTVTKWVFYIMLLRQWPTEDFGTLIDYYQRYLYMFHWEAPQQCEIIVEELRKEKSPINTT